MPLLARAQSLSVVTTPTTTTIALVVTPAAPATAPVPDHTVETLRATVSASGGPLTTGGTVNFYDTFTTPHLLGSAQINSSGVAVLRVLPGVGSHGFQAQFQGTTVANSSALSADTYISVQESVRFSNDVETYNAGNQSGYTLTTNIAHYGTTVPPTGTIFYQDTSNKNQQVGKVVTASPTTPSFVWIPYSRPAPTNPLTATIGDFNEDGYPDAVYTSSLSDGSAGTTIAVSLNSATGFGVFSALGPPIQVGSYPLTVTVGDFNADGHLDIATANLGDGTVTVVLGKGDGTFPMAMPPVSVGAYPFTLVTADFNRDGKLDLAVANLGDGTVSILLGTGDGNFAPAPKYTLLAGHMPVSLATADFDGNGTVDLVVTNCNDGTLTVYFGDGLGGFSNGMTLPAGPAPVSVLAADFNGDGYPDLAVVNQTAKGTVSILINTTSGSFSNPVVYAVGSKPYSIVAGNLLSAYLDLAVCNEGDNTISILQGTGRSDGLFKLTAAVKPIDFSSRNGYSNGMVSLALADFNGDGRPDLLAPDYGYPSSSYEYPAHDAIVFLSAYTTTVTQTGITVSGPGTHAVQSSYSYTEPGLVGVSYTETRCCTYLQGPAATMTMPPQKVITPTKTR